MPLIFCFSRRVVSCGLLLVALVGSAWGCTKSLRWHDDPPYSFRTSDGTITGVHVEIAREVMHRLGCEVELLDMPFARAITELQLGRLDVLPGVNKRPEREAFARFSVADPYATRSLLFLRRGTTDRVNGLNLRELVQGGFRLGAQFGVMYSRDYGAILQDKILAARVQLGSSRQGLWQALVHERFDGLIADELTAAYELRVQGLSDKVEASRLVVSDVAAYTAFSKRTVDAEFVARYDAALLALHKDGTLSKILDRYGFKH
jgi:polar amino acid transport system substrate-binding protein